MIADGRKLALEGVETGETTAAVGEYRFGLEDGMEVLGAGMTGEDGPGGLESTPLTEGASGEAGLAPGTGPSADEPFDEQVALFVTTDANPQLLGMEGCALLRCSPLPFPR